MSDNVLFSPPLSPIQQAQLRRYSIRKQPSNTFFDHVLGILYGSKRTDLSDVPVVTAHLYNGNTIDFDVHLITTNIPGAPDSGTPSIVSALNGYVEASRIGDPAMAMANFVLVSRMLTNYPSAHNVEHVITVMMSFVTTEFSWNSFFANKGSNDTLSVNKAAAVYTALYPIISGNTIRYPLRLLMQYAECNALCEAILKQYAANNISY